MLTPSLVQKQPTTIRPRRSSGNLTQKSAPVKKPSFETYVKVAHGDPQAINQARLYNRSKAARQQQTQQVQQQTDVNLFGQALPAVQGAYKNINPIAASIIKESSPTTIIANTAKDLKKGAIPQAALEASALIPWGPGKGIKAAKAAEEAAGAAKSARTIKNVARAAAKAEPTLGKRVVNQPATLKEAVAKVFTTEGEKAAFQRARDIAHEKAGRIEKARSAFLTAGEGSAGHEAFKAQLAGPYSQVPFGHLKDFTPEQISELTTAAYHHPDLTDLEALATGEALRRAKMELPPRDFEIALIKKAFGTQKAEEFAQGRSVAEAISNVVNIPRAIMASFDVSAPLRQGLMGFAMYPGQSAKALPGMFKSLASEKSYQAAETALTKKPDFERSVKAGVNYSHLSESIYGREEQFASQAAEKVTGLGPLIGKKPGTLSFVRASGRAYTGFLDNQRYNIFSTLAKEAERSKWGASDKLEKDLGIITNWATGRGNMTHKDLAVLANTFLFSPRLFKSRLDAINVLPGKHGFYSQLHPFARRKALASLTKLVATGTGVLFAASQLAGVKVELDPRSSDWGKIRYGDTRYDIWGGYQQIARTIAQLAITRHNGQWGQFSKSSTSGALTHLGKGHHLDPLVRLFQGKASPPIGTVIAWKQGKEFTGAKFSWGTEAKEKLQPLLLQDIQDAWHAGMAPFGIIGTFGIGSLGVGVQTYKPQNRPVGVDPFAR